MVFSLLTGSSRPISIIIKDHVIRFVELKSTTPLVIQRSGERTLPNGLIKEGKIIDRETLVMILEEVIQDWGIKNRRIQFIVPDSYVVIRKVEVPLDVMDDEIRGYLYYELGTSIHLPFENSVIDYALIGKNEEKKSVILFASPEEVVTEYTELFQEVKLKPVVADISPLSLYRLYFLNDQSRSDERLLFVQFDVTSVNLSILEDYKPIFMRHLVMEESEVESNDLTSPLQDYYREIERVMSFYQFSLNKGNQRITKVVVTGDHPMLQQIVKDISSLVDLPVEPLPIHDSSELSNGFQLVVGLALKEV
ncbi:pilus assembly protein PilM [Bacillus sp. BGMRC 2118]|nr:pilus assembly protein PilM [Bacillus sp. BGMRC 2118]